LNPETQELFDLALLRVLDANRTRFGLGATAIGHLLAPFGFKHPAPDLLLDRIDYLAGKGLIEEVLKGIDAANRAWRITPAGIDYMDQHG
jgi:hypothetical protein